MTPRSLMDTPKLKNSDEKATDQEPESNYDHCVHVRQPEVAA